MYFLGVKGLKYGNQKNEIYKNWIENFRDIERFNLIRQHRPLECYEFGLNDENFKYFYISYLYLLYNVCAYSYSSVGNFREIISVNQMDYIDFSLKSLYFDVL